jgi:nucleoside transporter
MFLEYVIWGAWLPLLALYLGDVLGFSAGQIGWVFATQAIASLVGLFGAGQIADRVMPTERLLALLHLGGALAMFVLSAQRTFWPFFTVMLGYQLAYVPTLSLANSLSFHHLRDAQAEFGRVRLWGTIGWIAASWPFVLILGGKTGAALASALGSIFTVAGLASVALAVFSLTLPATPPASHSGERNAPFEAVKLLAVPAFLALFTVTFLDALVHQCYFQWTSPFLKAAGLRESWIMPAMSVGQVAEIATMAGLGFFLKRFGWRATMTLGILAHALRFFIYHLGSPLWLMVAVNVVHGFAYAFFFASVYIFVDEQFPRDSRASAQGLFNLLILGIGPFVGSLFWGWLGDRLRTPEGAVDFSALFLFPATLALAAAVLLVATFRPPARARGLP